MFQNALKKIFSVFLILFLTGLPAQQRSGISLDIRNESRTDKAGILDLIMVLNNEGATDFKGKIEMALPTGFRNISGNSIQVSMKSGERLSFL